jgi:outer membrane receptor for ferrienterochelin and colicins
VTTRLLSRVALVTGALVVTETQVTAQSDSGKVTLAVRQGVRPVVEAIVRSDGIRTQTDAAGIARLRLPVGLRQLIVANIGFRPETIQVAIRPQLDTTITVQLLAQAALTPVVVTATRVSHRLEDEPVRVEVLTGEDIDEKTEMRPADLTVLLREISGVRVQPTSPALGAANIRIQGLPGRYTQVLSDGLPLYGGQIGGLGLLQIPPLDLRQAEVIKGAATALYGPTALGGVVNLVSRSPVDRQEILLNQTSRAGTDGVLWVGKRLSDQWGYTVVGGVHHQDRVDVNGDGWADLPGFERAELRPRVYWHGDEGRSLFATVGGMAENRTGGTVAGAVAPDGQPYGAGVNTSRLDGGLVAVLPLGAVDTVAVRGVATSLWQHHRFGLTIERDRQSTLFSEVTLTLPRGRAVWLLGAALERDGYHAADVSGFDYTFTAPALFAQTTISLTQRIAISASGRCDAHSHYGTICSPRVSVLVPVTRAVTARLSGATGFFGPTPFTEETEEIGLSRLRPSMGVRREQAQYASLDLTGKRGPLEVNGTFFASTIHDPVLLRDSSNVLELVNATGPTRTSGVEFYAVYLGEPLTITADYAYLRSTQVSPETGTRGAVPLNPRHSAGLDVAWDNDETGTRVGIEAFYTGREAVDHDPYRTTSRPYTTLGVLVSQRIGPALLYLNAEDLTDVRQTRYDRLLLPAPGEGGRWTTDEWAPLEGRLVNLGVRLGL